MREAQDIKELGRNDLCHCGSGKKYKKCHMVSDRNIKPTPRWKGTAAGSARERKRPGLIKTPAQIDGIRKACQLNRRLLDMLEGRIEVGVTTEQIDRWVYEMTLAEGGIPAPLNYKGYPKSVCTSINEVVCHGIPEERELVSGDIVNVDVSTVLDSYFGDSSRMYMVGDVSPEARRLVLVTQECLELGISQVKSQGFVGDIGHIIQEHAEKNGYSVVREFVGHGIGLEFHEEPQIPHFGRKGDGPPLLPGMIFTIEPMINQGKWPIQILADGWTAVTRDRTLSAQYEHTVLVTPTGVEVLTA